MVARHPWRGHTVLFSEDGVRLTTTMKRKLTESRAELFREVRDMIREVLALPPNHPIDPSQQLFELGFRSMNVVELRNKLEQAHSISMPATLFFTHSTLELLVDCLVAMTTAETAEADVRSHSDGRRRESEPEFGDIAAMSEEEAEARLLSRIAEISEE